eukprot:4133842-Prymnesium_polylepis.1
MRGPRVEGESVRLTMHLLHLLPVGDVGLHPVQVVVVVVVALVILVVAQRDAHVVALPSRGGLDLRRRAAGRALRAAGRG